MSAQNPIASSAGPHARHRREVTVAAAIAAAGVALFVAAVAAAGSPSLGALLASIVFAWVFIPCPALSVSRWVVAVRSRVAQARLPRTAVTMILAAIGPAAYAAFAPLMPAGVGGVLPFSGAFDLAVVELVLLLVPLEGIGFTFQLGRRDWLTAGIALLAFTAIAIPLGLAIGFIRWGVVRLGPLELTALAFRIYFLIALTEELVFRGLLQNLLERRLFGGSRWPWSLAITSVVFGASHLGHPPVPNLRYGVLATLAGVAYGFVWHRTRKITASALTHCAVDLVWRVLFGG